MNQIPLSNVIAALRNEIETARRNAANKKLQFTVSDIELELEFVIQEDKDAKFGVNIFGVDVDVAGKQTEGTTHKVKLSLDPRVLDEDGNPVNPTISQTGEWQSTAGSGE